MEVVAVDLVEELLAGSGEVSDLEELQHVVMVIFVLAMLC